MTLDQVVVWIIVGGLTGLFADSIVRRLRIGVVGAMLVGILGGLTGGWLLGMFGISPGSGVVSELAKALIGAVALLLLLRSLRKL